MKDEELPERDPEKDLAPEGMDKDSQQDTESAAEKIAGAMEFVIGAQSDTPDKLSK